MTVIRKKEQKKKTEATPKKRGRPSKADSDAASSVATTALARATTTTLARVESSEVTEEHSKLFVREAQRLDEKIVKTIDRLQKDVIVLGELFDEMHTKGYHRALGFARFEEYLKARYPDQSKTQVFQAMRIVRELTGGENPSVSKDDVREMPRDNAEALAKMKKAGVTITPQLVEDAKTMPIRRFQDEIVLPMTPEMEGRTSARASEMLAQSEPEVYVRRSFTLSGTVASNLAKAVEIAKWMTVNAAHDPGESFDDRVVSAIVGEFLSAYQADYDEVMRNERAKAQHAAQMTEDELGPDVPEAEVEEEYRVPAVEEGDESEATS